MNFLMILLIGVIFLIYWNFDNIVHLNKLY